MTGPGEVRRISRAMIAITGAVAPLDKHFATKLRDSTIQTNRVFGHVAAFTREDVVEIHCHGSYLLLSRILELILAAGVRLADPGEFTKRAFQHGKLDLTEAEGLADLVDAETEAQRRQARRQLGAQAAAVLRAWTRGTTCGPACCANLRE